MIVTECILASLYIVDHQCFPQSLHRKHLPRLVVENILFLSFFKDAATSVKSHSCPWVGRERFSSSRYCTAHVCPSLSDGLFVLYDVRVDTSHFLSATGSLYVASLKLVYFLAQRKGYVSIPPGLH